MAFEWNIYLSSILMILSFMNFVTKTFEKSLGYSSFFYCVEQGSTIVQEEEE